MMTTNGTKEVQSGGCGTLVGCIKLVRTMRMSHDEERARTLGPETGVTALLGIGSMLLGHAIMYPLWLTSDVTPIFGANIRINLHGQNRAIHAVSTSPLRAGNPVIVTGRFVVVIGFETCALEALEGLTMVVECTTRLGKRHATNPRRASQCARFALDIHNAPNSRLRFLSRGRPKTTAP